MMKINNLKIRTAALAIAASSLISFVGCEKEQELAPSEDYDMVQIADLENENLSFGLVQELIVPGQDFKLVTSYNCDDSSKREWRITSDKFLYFNVHTKGLPSDVIVYIDNVHMDTSIKSKYAVVDGIIQDTMDDHVHSSQMIGMYIDNDSYYYGVNAIEGCNATFLQLTGYGANGYYGEAGETKRRLESDYLEMGVYANKVQVVYDLLVKGPNDKDFTNVSVCSDFLVPVTNSEISKEKVKKK